MAKVWVRIDMVNKECYVGSIETYYEDDEDLELLLEEQAYFGIKIDNVHRCRDDSGKIVMEPLDENSIYKDSMIIMSTDNILTIRFLREDSDIVKELSKKVRENNTQNESAKNVLKFRQVKKEKI